MCNYKHAIVVNISSFTTPSGQVKPSAKIRVDGESELREFSLVTFNNLYNRRIVPGTKLTFDGELRFGKLVNIEPPQGNHTQQKMEYMYLSQECPVCHSKTVRYKRDYWCTNINCIASKTPRLKRVLTNSPAKLFYNIKSVLSWSKTQKALFGYELFDYNNVPLYRHLLLDKYAHVDDKEIQKQFIDTIKTWPTESKLLCLDARINIANAKKLTQGGSVSLDIINKYTVRDMISLGIPQLEAFKIRTLLDYEHNQQIINKILEVEKKVGENP